MTSAHDPYAPYASRDPISVDADGSVVDHTGKLVPKGTSAEVLDWVGDDKGKANQALVAEKATSKPRKGLVEELEEIVEK